MGGPSIPFGGPNVSICLGDETVTQQGRVWGTDAFDIVLAQTYCEESPRLKSCHSNAPILYTATLAVASSQYLWSCQEENSLAVLHSKD